MRRLLLGFVLAAVAIAPAVAGPTWSLDASETTYSYVCGGSDWIAINGHRNSVTVSGECGVVEVNGSDNRLVLEAVGSIRVYGDNNDITYARAVKGKKPTVKKKGSSNTVRRSE